MFTSKQTCVEQTPLLSDEAILLKETLMHLNAKAFYKGVHI